MALRWKLLLWIGLPVLLIFLLVLGLQYRQLDAMSRAQAGERELNELMQRAASLDNDLRAIELSLTATAGVLARDAVPSTPDADADAKLRVIATELLTANPILSGIEVAREGTQAARVRLLRDGSEIRPAALERASAYVRGWSAARVADAPRYAVFSIRSEQPGNVITIRADLASRALATALSAPLTGKAVPMLLDADGRYIWHEDGQLLAADATIFEQAAQADRPGDAALARELLAGKAQVRAVQSSTLANEPALILNAPVRSAGWTLLAVLPQRELSPANLASIRNTALLMLVGLVGVLIIIWFASRRVTRPLSELARQSELLLPGDPFEPAVAAAPRVDSSRVTLQLDMISRNVREAKDRIADETARREMAEGELRVARRMQESLLPTPLSPEALQPFRISLHAINVPAIEVAGDFFDHFTDSHGRLIICIADVSGKGASAAMLMAVARTALRGAVDAASGPADIIRTINRVLIDTTHDIASFVTMLVLVIERDGSMKYANAGHPPAICVRASAKAMEVAPATGTVVGIMLEEDVLATEAELDLPADWTHLVLVTDGVLEATQGGVDREDARGQRRVMFGSQRLQHLVAAAPGASARVLSNMVVDAIKRFEGATRSDDVTVLVLARERA